MKSKSWLFCKKNVFPESWISAGFWKILAHIEKNIKFDNYSRRYHRENGSKNRSKSLFFRALKIKICRNQNWFRNRKSKSLKIKTIRIQNWVFTIKKTKTTVRNCNCFWWFMIGFNTTFMITKVSYIPEAYLIVYSMRSSLFFSFFTLSPPW